MAEVDLIPLSRDAWNALRSETQPVFDELEGSYKQRLLDRAQSVVDRGLVSEDGGVFQTFDQNVLETLQPERFHPLSKQFRPDLFPDPIPEDVKEELVAEAQVVPDSPEPEKPKNTPKKAAAKKAAEKKPVKVIKKGKK